MSGYCTEADVLLEGNSQLGAQLIDYDKDGTADTGVAQRHIDKASHVIRGIAIMGRADYKDLTTLVVSTFDPATSAYQGLRMMTAWLAFDMYRGAYRQNQDGVLVQHPVIVWAHEVRNGTADLT